MPTDRGQSTEPWHPKPDFQSRMAFAPVIDERVFEIYRAEDVAECLLETDPSIEVYSWTLTDLEKQELALESAKQIVGRRRNLLMDRELQKEFQLAKAARDARFEDSLKGAPKSKVAVIVGITEDLDSGKTTMFSNEVDLGRSYA